MSESTLWNEPYLKSNNIGWRFPSTDGGEEEGFNNAEINHFTGGLDSLTREVVQNSIDAAADSQRPHVVIEFSLIKLPIKEAFPYRDEYLERIERCSASASGRTEEIVHTAIDTLNSADLYTLRISDYQTTGLTNPRGKSAKESSFYSLLKGSGVSVKETGEGGSYGLGKIAPILCSGLRAVFYYSKDVYGNAGFQGKCMLASHRWNSENGEYLTRRVGYFGHMDMNSTPLIDAECQNIPEFLRERTEPGTDIFVLGISKEEAEDWNATIKFSLLRNFFIAISEGKLTCRIKEPDGSTTEINAGNLSEQFDHFAQEIADLMLDPRNDVSDPDKDPVRFYSAYTKGQRFEITEEKYAAIAGSYLYLLPMVNLPQYLYPKNVNTSRTRILFSRKPGMMVYTKQRNSVIPSIIVFIGKGDEINAVLQSCEPAAHDNWDYKNITGNIQRNPLKKNAKNCLELIQSWISECLNSLNPKSEDDFDVIGLGEELGMEQTVSEKPEPIQVHEHRACRPSPFSRLGQQNDEGETGMSAAKLVRKDRKAPVILEERHESSFPASPGNEGENGQMPAPMGSNASSGGLPRMDAGDKPLQEDEAGVGAVPRSRKSAKKPKAKSRKTIDFRDFRCVAGKEPGRYVIMFTPEYAISRGKVYISIIGDVDSETARIKSAALINGMLGSIASGKSTYVSLQNIPAEMRVKLNLELEYKERSSLSIAIEGVDNE